MQAKLQRRIQRYGWDKAAQFYEKYWQQQLAPSQTLLLQMADLQAGERVLDLACGTGLVSFPAAKKVGQHGEVIGTDLSENMVQTARCLAADRGLTNTRFLRMDAEEIRFENDAFDAVLCALGMMYFPDPLKALQEMLRVLQPGGRAVAAVWGERQRCGWAEIFPIVDARVNTDVCPLFFQLGTGEALAMQFRNAGFERIESRRISTILRYPTAEDACAATFEGGPVALAHAGFDEQTRQQAYAEYIDSIAPYRNGAGYEIPGEFVVVRGYKQNNK